MFEDGLQSAEWMRDYIKRNIAYEAGAPKRKVAELMKKSICEKVKLNNTCVYINTSEGFVYHEDLIEELTNMGYKVTMFNNNDCCCISWD